MTTVPEDRAGAATSAVSPVVSAHAGGRRRRPSGEPPPLPRADMRGTARYAAAVIAAVVLAALLNLAPCRRIVTAVDVAVLQAIEALRSTPATAVMRSIDVVLGSVWTPRFLVWAAIVVLLAARRLRHLLTLLVVVLAATLTTAALSLGVARMRPVQVAILRPWDGYAFPSRPVAALAVALSVGLLTLVPRGRVRRRGGYVAATLVAALCLARAYLAVDHPTDLLAAVAIGAALPVTLFRVVTPEEAFPVTYSRGTRAHLDLSAERCAAITAALRQQLGLHMTALAPFGLAGSAGSTPLRVQVRRADGSAATLFGKLYAVNHLRADRWYKTARTIFYGRLEDEKPFSTVRRLVEYEDHLLRLLRDAGLPTPLPYGFVEITPEREYLIVMEFFDGATEMCSADLGTGDIDDGLRIVRRLWEAGVAHRDIKPSNLLVRDGRVKLIDVAFGTVRPTPWRQAVDLANMMLTLALRTDADTVYGRALRQFAAEDIAEAFAASHSITVPTQLRSLLKDDGRELQAAFCRLAPPRDPVPIQLWSVRRVAVTVSVLFGCALVVLAAIAALEVANLL